LIFLSLWRMILEFWWTLHWICRLLSVIFLDINSVNPWTWEIFPSSDVLFNFFIVFNVEVFYLLKFIPRYFYAIENTRNCFQDFFPSLFIVVT
jgi:hypothetical protein